VSPDMLHWTNLPIAIYPDSAGTIFSGSAVVDVANTSGLGTKENPPLVAIYTIHNAAREREGSNDFQTQAIAYSVDAGKTWIKYPGNPVLPNPGIRDFRDPKVFWYEPSGQWVMTLAVADHIEFYRSPNLLQWEKLSEFGKTYGGHGGVWECPDLFPLPTGNGSDVKWVLIVNINPGGPNGGSATQYFVGDFDGTTFTSDTKPPTTLWLDFGPDDYAGITWSNAPDDRKIFFGWMSNWDYATVVPTTVWRSANTLPRDLRLQRVDSIYRVSSTPSPEFQSIVGEKEIYSDLEVADSYDFSKALPGSPSQFVLEASLKAGEFIFVLSNDQGQALRFGLNATGQGYFVDRREAGRSDFSERFTGMAYAPRLTSAEEVRITAVVDVASIELFLDDGLTVMTVIFFPDEPMNKLSLVAPAGPVQVNELRMGGVESTWSPVR